MGIEAALGTATPGSRIGTPFETYAGTFPPPASWSADGAAMVAMAAGLRALLRDADIPPIRIALKENVLPPPEGVVVGERFAVPRLDPRRVPDALWAGSLGRKGALTPLEAEWITPEGGPDKEGPMIIMFHGGGYIVGSPQGSRAYPYRIVKDHGIPVMSVDYALAPENPFPLAVLDAVSSILYAVSQGWPASRIVLTGDSAGAGLCFAAAMVVRDFGKEMKWPMPAGLAPLTPYVDMSLNSPTLLLGSLDPASPFSLCCLTHKACRDSTTSYAGTAYPFDPQIASSPYFTPVVDRKPGLCPSWVLTGGHDTLLAEDGALALRRNAAGDRCILEIWEEMPHDPHLLAGPETMFRESIASMARFVRAATSDPGKIVGGYFSCDPLTGKRTELSGEQLQDRIRGYVDAAKKQGLFAEVVGGEEAAQMYANILA
ncbi:Alpha/Beta hydrolase protein [Hyaloraphidium curvatum]|nr:Alpha/Beta hydrolase protein [Hyaloraphidium curvatum]